jgi:hypothetical protein
VQLVENTREKSTAALERALALSPEGPATGFRNHGFLIVGPLRTLSYRILEALFAGLSVVQNIRSKVENEMTVYSYARVSSEGQSLTAQVAKLKDRRLPAVFQEKISGARSDRKQLARLLAEPDDGDTVIVTRRSARNLR